VNAPENRAAATERTQIMLGGPAHLTQMTTSAPIPWVDEEASNLLNPYTLYTNLKLGALS
jgi:hypothetical protein